MLKKYTCVVLCLFVLFTIGINPSFSELREFSIATHKLPTSPDGIFLNLVYTEVFRRLSVKLKYKVYPAKRIERMAGSRELDGEFSRIYHYGDSQPNLVRVEEPHWESGFLAVGVDPKIKLNGWHSLNSTSYKIVYRRGIKGCEINLPKYVKAGNLDKVSNIYSGFHKVMRNWADIYVGSEMDVLSALDSNEFKRSDLRIVGIMDKFTAHMYLHKRHKIFALRAAKILKEMKEEGLLDKYRKQAGLKSYIGEKENTKN